MSELVEHLNFFDKILQLLPIHVPLAELFHSDFGTHPPGLVDITVATPADDI